MARTLCCFLSIPILTEREKIGICEGMGLSLRIAAGFLFKHQVSWFLLLCFGCTLSHFSKVIFQGTKIYSLKNPGLELLTGRERHQRRLWCNTFKMGNYDLSKYSPYVDSMTMAYSAGNKSGQSPAEISITEMGTHTARAELIKRQNSNQNWHVIG